MKKPTTLKKQVAGLNATILKLTKVIETLQESVLTSLTSDVQDLQSKVATINRNLSNLESMDEIVNMYETNGGSLDFYDDEEVQKDISYNEDMNDILQKHILNIELNTIVNNEEKLTDLFFSNTDVFINETRYELDDHWLNLVRDNVSDENLFLQYTDEMSKIKNFEYGEPHSLYRTKDNQLHIFKTLKEMVAHKLASDFETELKHKRNPDLKTND